MERVNITVAVGVYDQWKGIESLEIEEDFEELVNRLNYCHKINKKFIIVNLVDGRVRAINIDKIVDVYKSEHKITK